MAYSETGHNVNVANLNKLNQVIITLGTAYNPSKVPIQLVNLQKMYDNGSIHIAGVQTFKNKYSTRVDEREYAFRDIKSYSTRLMGALSGTNVSRQIIKDAKTINAKIQTKKIDNPNNPKPVGEEKDKNVNNDPTSKKHSISRQSHITLHENFSDLVNLLLNAEGYDPNETEFQQAYLEAYTDALKTANENIDTAMAQVADKRIARNLFLYDADNGLVNAALDAKNYIKGLFGASSPQFLLADKIHFRNIS